MAEKKTDLRLAGWLYLALALIAPFSLSYVPGVIEQADGTLVQRLTEYELLLRLSMASEMFYQIIEVFIVLALYSYFCDTHAKLALQMLVLGLLPLPIVFLNELNLVGAIASATADVRLSGIGLGFQEYLVPLLYELHGKGLTIASIFWGLWLIPLGRLVLMSRAVPNFFGYSVILGAAGYFISAAAILILPALVPTSIIESLTLAGSLLMIGEVPIIAGLFWAGYNH
jgi:hypothetical protein